MLSKDVRFSRFLLILLLACIAWFSVGPVPGLSEKALHMIIIFILSMAGIVLEVAPAIAFLLMTMLLANLTGTMEVKDGFSGFCNVVPWLLFLVLSLSKAVTKSSLGMRLAYLFMRFFGRGIIGLSYSLILTEFFVAPVLPSNTARGASLGLPLVKSLSQYISTHAKGVSEKKIGEYLTLLYSYSNAVCSAMFLTAMISNSIILESMESNGISMAWMRWLCLAIIPCAAILLVMPFVLRFILGFKIKDLGKVRYQASKNYRDLGPLSLKEKVILMILGFMLVMWIFSDSLGIPIFVTTLLGVCVFMILGILDTKEIVSSYSTFNSVLMLGILISYVNCLTSFGAIEWFNGVIANHISGLSHNLAFVSLSVIYFFTHYFFTGEGSRIIALYVPFLTTGIALGLDKVSIAMTLAVFSSLSDVLVSYSGPVALTMYSSGYVSSKKWISCGFIVAIVEMFIWFLYILFL